MALEEPKFEKPSEEQLGADTEESLKATAEALESQKQEEAEERYKGWKEHFGILADMQEEQEKAEQELAREKKGVEAAEIPPKGIEAEEILKEVGIKKPAESFEEVQNRLAEEIKGTRMRSGERPSSSSEYDLTRNFYLNELGYSVKYKGLLRGKVEILNEEGESIKNKEGKPKEFKTYFSPKGETPLIKFLKEEAKNKFEGKPEEKQTEKKEQPKEKEQTEEEKWEAGAQKATKETDRKQEEREEKISVLQEAKKVGMGRLSKLVEGLAYVAGLDRLAVPAVKAGKEVAVRGGKWLAMIGLTPVVAAEEVGRKIAGLVQIRTEALKGVLNEARVEYFEDLKKLSPEKRAEYYPRVSGLIGEITKETTQERNKGIKSGFDKMCKKGIFLRYCQNHLL